MDTCLRKAELEDAQSIHEMQVKAFKSLLDEYRDYETNPGNESLEKIISRINEEKSDYYIVNMDKVNVGAIRVVKVENKIYRVSPIFVLPEYQGRGIAQKVFELIETLYSDAIEWRLDTILQEKGNCYLYEKLGYRKTGETKVVNDKLTIVFYSKQCLALEYK